MKTKFDNRQLAHVWAQQNQPRGDGSNFYFVGPSIYSYGSHFEIARFITRKGARAVLFTTRGYSVTTAKHISMTRGALYGLGMPAFHVHDIDDAARGGDATREAYKERVRASVERAATCRKPERAVMEMEGAQSMAREASRYAQFFGQRWRIAEPAYGPEALAALRATMATRQARLRKAEARREAQRARERAEMLAEWRRHERVTIPFVHTEPTALRLSQDGLAIETSRGASVPATVARLVWDAVTDTRASGAAFEPAYADRPRLGAFTLDRIDGAGNVTAGCHVLPYSELHALAVRFGFVTP